MVETLPAPQIGEAGEERTPRAPRVEAPPAPRIGETGEESVSRRHDTRRSHVAHVLEIVWLGIVLLAGPLGAVATRNAMRRELPSRTVAYASTIRGLVVLAVLTFVADGFGSRFGLRALEALPSAVALAGWTAGTLAASVVISLIFVAIRRSAKVPMSRLARLMLPEQGGDWAMFALMCATTGFCEELVFRGFGLGLLGSMLHSPVMAVAILSVFFGLGHVAQNRLGAVRAAVLGVALAVPVLATGALLPSILAHAATNLLTPLWAREGGARGDVPAG